MSTPVSAPERRTLRTAMAAAAANAGLSDAGLSDAKTRIAYTDLAARTRLAPGVEVADRAVLVRVGDQLSAAVALAELDGVARRLVICPPDLDAAHLPRVCADAGIDAAVLDGPAPETLPAEVARLQLGEPRPREAQAGLAVSERSPATQWVMFTSGTSGAPKMVAHTLASLTGAIAPAAPAPRVVWATFYDIRRYGGLQILLRALLGGHELVLSDAHGSEAAFLARVARAGVTHISGTPTHWRWALANPAIGAIAPDYVRLSGEIADQAVLDSLKAAFPAARIGHAYASTEAGVGFEVNDGRAGFPAALVGRAGAVAMKVEDGTLRLRSARAAGGYLGPDGSALADAEGFVDTGDLVERVGERYLFAGRRGGIINVGGLKVSPEEVEAVINAQPGVRMSRVFGRKNPLIGALVVAEVVADPAAADPEAFKRSVLDACRAALPPAKVPAVLRLVETLAVTPAGKLERRGA